MGRPKSRLNSVIDVEITKAIEAVGVADASSIYSILRLDHDDMVQAELAEDARRGLMRRIELRLKQYVVSVGEGEAQISLPGISDKLLARIDEMITVPRDDGSCAYLHIRHENTTVGDVLSHIAMLRGQEDAIQSKVAAWREVVHRCGTADYSTSLIKALSDEAKRPPRSPHGEARTTH